MAVVASLLLTQAVRWVAPKLGALDQLADRKIHRTPIPRIGGVAVVGAMAVTFLAAALAGLLPNHDSTADLLPWGGILAGGAVIFVCGVWDDFSPLSARTKFLAQCAAAGIAVWSGVHLDRVALAGDHVLELGILSIPLTIFWIVGITNAFNLIDGLDGLAAGLGSIAAGTCAAIFIYTGAIDDATVLLVLMGALLGFLPFNFNPAKVFLGDSGSLVLGYVLSVMVVTGSQKYATATAVIVPILTFGIPIIDTLLSLARRMFNRHHGETGKKFSLKDITLMLKQAFIADRDHIHHRLIGRGLSHRGAVLVLYAAAAALSLLALVSVLAQYRNALFLLLTVAVATAIGIAKLGYLRNGVSRLGSVLQRVDRPKFDRSFFFGFADLLLIVVAYWGAYALLVESPAPAAVFQWYFNMFPVVALVQLSVFWIGGLYRGLWRAIGVGDLMRVAMTVSIGGVLSYSLVMIGQPPEGAGSLFVVHTLVMGWLMGGLRSAYRLFDHSQFFGNSAGRTTLIYGAGAGGRLSLRELRQNSSSGFHAIGFIDDDLGLQGRLISGIPVMGAIQDLKLILMEKRVQNLIVSSRKIAGPSLQHALSVCRENGIRVFRADYLFQPLSSESAEGSMPGLGIPGMDRIGESRPLRSAVVSTRKTAV